MTLSDIACLIWKIRCSKKQIVWWRPELSNWGRTKQKNSTWSEQCQICFIFGIIHWFQMYWNVCIQCFV